MSPRNVFITGCSTGIGRVCALDLDRKGFRVFAGVRKSEDARSLKEDASGGLEPVLVDVTDQEEVSRAAEYVGKKVGEDGLHGLVNNAGVGVSGPMECVPLNQFQRVMEINVTGHVMVTQAFLPLLRKARGRIVFMGSESGRFTLPMVGAYSASKHALEAVANAFRAELISSGVRVSMVEPASIRTPIWDKINEENEKMVECLPENLRQIYGRELKASSRMTANLARVGIGPEKVSRAVLHALTSNHPKARYVVGLEARLLIAGHAILPLKATAWMAHRALKLLGR